MTTLISISAMFSQVAVFGGVDEVETIPEGLGRRSGERIVERSRTVRVQVVHDDCDLVLAGVALGDVLQE